MSDTPMRMPDHLPVLTEVLEPALQRSTSGFEANFPPIDLDFNDAVVADDPVTAVQPSPQAPMPVASAPSPSVESSVDMGYLAQRVRGNIQLQLEHMLEARLREAVLPMLTQQTDLLVQRLRGDLLFWLDDMVEKAVAQEIARHKS